MSRAVTLTAGKLCPAKRSSRHAHARKNPARRSTVRESLRTDSLDFDRFRSPNRAARDVFCKFFLHAVHRRTARKIFAFKALFCFRNRRAGRASLKNAARIKPLFHRTICSIGIFAPLYRANAMSSASGFVFCGLRDRFSRWFWAAYAQRRCRVTFFFRSEEHTSELQSQR